MNSVTPTNTRMAGDDLGVATVEIGIDGSRDALDLISALSPFHSFIVQHDREHWVVYPRTPGHNDETLNNLVTAEWVSDRDVNQFASVLDLRAIALTHLSDVAGRKERS